MYTYVHRPDCKKENTATYVYIRAGSRTRTTMSSCSSAANRFGQNRGDIIVVIGRQPTGSEYVLFIGSQPAWMEQPKRGLAYRRMEETALCSTAYGQNGILFTGRGLAYRKTEETDFSSTSILRYARPLPINRTPVSTVGGPFPPFCGTPDPSR